MSQARARLSLNDSQSLLKQLKVGVQKVSMLQKYERKSITPVKVRPTNAETTPNKNRLTKSERRSPPRVNADTELLKKSNKINPLPIKKMTPLAPVLRSKRQRTPTPNVQKPSNVPRAHSTSRLAKSSSRLNTSGAFAIDRSRIESRENSVIDNISFRCDSGFDARTVRLLQRLSQPPQAIVEALRLFVCLAVRGNAKAGTDSMKTLKWLDLKRLLSKMSDEEIESHAQEFKSMMPGKLKYTGKQLQAAESALSVYQSVVKGQTGSYYAQADAIVGTIRAFLESKRSATQDVTANTSFNESSSFIGVGEMTIRALDGDKTFDQTQLTEEALESLPEKKEVSPKPQKSQIAQRFFPPLTVFEETVNSIEEQMSGELSPRDSFGKGSPKWKNEDQEQSTRTKEFMILTPRENVLHVRPSEIPTFSRSARDNGSPGRDGCGENQSLQGGNSDMRTSSQRESENPLREIFSSHFKQKIRKTKENERENVEERSFQSSKLEDSLRCQTLPWKQYKSLSVFNPVLKTRLNKDGAEENVQSSTLGRRQSSFRGEY